MPEMTISFLNITYLIRNLSKIIQLLWLRELYTKNVLILQGTVLVVLGGYVGVIRLFLMMVSYNVYLELGGKLQGVKNLPSVNISLSCLGPAPSHVMGALCALSSTIFFSIAEGNAQLHFSLR